MAFKNILFAISIIFLIVLWVDNVMLFDIAATKNNGLVFQMKQEIDNSKSIDSVKILGKKYIDVIQRDRIENSLKATKKNWLFLFLIFIQSSLWYLNRKRLKA